ncbi:MAG: hypothetical protein KIT07_06470 [Anaerolineales bacterium]|nr:hypothetical protein [Anaerolineales bacterium]
MTKSSFPANKTFFLALTDVFGDYLSSMEAFIEKENKAHEEGIKGIRSKIERGEIIPSNDSDGMSVELEYDSWRLDRIEEFTRIFRQSFLVSLYSFLESTLCEHIRCDEPETKKHLKRIKKKEGGSNIELYLIYLEKVMGVRFPKVSEQDREEIRNFTLLRNAIVHADARIENIEKLKDRQRVERYVEDNQHLNVDYWLEIEKEYCGYMLDKILLFLENIMFHYE